jgi:glycosyltransferase involved in cell wall biosynthesis
VTPYFYPKPGGLERYTYEVCRRLAETHEIKVLCSGERGSVEQLDGMKVIKTKRDFVVSNTPVALKTPKIFTKLSEWCDVVYAHTPVPFFSDISLIFKKKPTVVVYHSATISGKGFTGILAKVYNAVHRALKEVADLKIAVSKFVLKKVDADSVIEPGVDSKFFHPAGKKEDYLLFVGQLNRGHEWKGLDLLIGAVKETGDNLIVIGDGNKRGEYELMSKKLGVNVTFKGRISDEVLRNYYSKSKLFILPSKSDQEAFGMCLLEANSCGTGVVGTKVGGIPCYIRNEKNGLLCDPNVSSLSEAIMKAEEKYMKLGKNGRKIAGHYTWEKTAIKTEEALNEAVCSVS